MTEKAREQERREEKKKQISFFPLGHLPKAYNSQGQDNPKPSARNSIQVFHTEAGI